MSNPGEVFQRYVDAVHAADLAEVKALIAPDVMRSDFAGCQPDMDNVSCLLHYINSTVISPRARLLVLRCEVEGERVAAELEVRSSLYRAAGVERILGRDLLTVRGGLIREFRFVPDLLDDATRCFFASLGLSTRGS